MERQRAAWQTMEFVANRIEPDPLFSKSCGDSGFSLCCEPEIRKQGRKTGGARRQAGGSRLARRRKRGEAWARALLGFAEGETFIAVQVIVHPNNASTFCRRKQMSVDFDDCGKGLKHWGFRGFACSESVRLKLARRMHCFGAIRGRRKPA